MSLHRATQKQARAAFPRTGVVDMPSRDGCDAARRVIAHLRKSAAGQQKRADRLARAASLNHAPKESDASDSAVFLAGAPASDLRTLAASARELTPFASSSREENEAYARGVTDGQAVLAHRLLRLRSADWPSAAIRLRGSPPTPDANRPAGRLLVHWACSTCGLRAAGTLAELNAAGMAWLKCAWQAHEAACREQASATPDRERTERSITLAEYLTTQQARESVERMLNRKKR